NNIVYNTYSGGLMYNNGGHEHVIRNNVFALSARQALWPFYEKRINSFRNNIIYFTQGDLMIPWAQTSLLQRIAAKEQPGDWDNNVYYNPNQPDFTFYDKPFAEWQALGLDQHSVIADPQFVDAAKYDFRLKPGSPALALGFKPIDTSSCGITRPASLVKLARSIKRPASVIPSRTAVAPLSLNDGFETTPVGTEPEHATLFGETGTASMRVSEEQAATGKRSLRFEDAPGLEYVFNPHLWYVPNINEGTTTCSYDLRLGTGAIFWNEWRDTANPYRIGPSLGVDAAGKLTTSAQLGAPQQELLTLPHDQWIHFETVCAVGKQASGTWKLTVTLPGQQPQTFDKLPCDPKFKSFQWLGFVSNAVEKTVFYVDNLKLSTIGKQNP
ncbi:MAG: hypothetical protein WCP21_03915, partial [Armatimonadota bacterium]